MANEEENTLRHLTMSMEEAEERNAKRPRLEDPPHPATLLTNDLILEILCRLPARSIHRFKCVSVAWRDLIADPASRKKLFHTQALAGFLFTSDGNSLFASVSGAPAPFDPSLPYLHRRDDEGIAPVDACNGLLLYRHYKTRNKANPRKETFLRFFVCNPATKRWVKLPSLPEDSDTAGLAFDPAVSSHFHVLHFEKATRKPYYITGVNIYSSRTRAWTSHKKDTAGTMMADKVILSSSSSCVFVGGIMYLIGRLSVNYDYVLVGVDMEGKVWRTIRLPYSSTLGMIGSSQGCLHYAISYVDDDNGVMVSKVRLWCLKDEGFVLKHTAGIDEIMSATRRDYKVAQFHPHCDTVFLVSTTGRGDTLASCDMQHQKVARLFDLKKNDTHRLLPYVPLFSESLADADKH